MAHYRLHVKPGPKGTGAEHAQYIERGGRFKAEKYGEIGEHEHGNLPAWAKGSAARFFAAADDHERANGNAYREFELALPVELSAAEHGRLVREFVKEQLGERHAYAWAIHEPTGHNPHAHVMFSERIIDGIERGPERYFKRANRQSPERGGQLKSDWFSGAGGPEAVEALRSRWAELQNQVLERAGVAARVDHRSLKAQGIEREAGQHRGPAVSGIEARGQVAEVSVRREAERVERAQARAAVEAQVRVVTRQELALERVAVRERRELALEVTGPEREMVLPLVEADRREQLGRAQAAAERRVERRQGLSIGSQLKDKLLTQARALRERIGEQLGRVKAWVAERFPEPLKQVKERSRDLFDTVVEKAQRAMGRADDRERVDGNAPTTTSMSLAEQLEVRSNAVAERIDREAHAPRGPAAGHDDDARGGEVGQARLQASDGANELTLEQQLQDRADEVARRVEQEIARDSTARAQRADIERQRVHEETQEKLRERGRTRGRSLGDDDDELTRGRRR